MDHLYTWETVQFVKSMNIFARIQDYIRTAYNSIGNVFIPTAKSSSPENELAYVCCSAATISSFHEFICAQ